ncbi:MAG: S8 family serine peptidase, partial [Candidatus Neomarinimicrobiota bacterium]
MRRVTTVLLGLVGILLAGSHFVVASQQEKSKHIIVPGVRVGEYTIGMSKDEVLRKLGEPKKIHLGDESYTLNNLPRRYNMIFDDIAFEIDNDSVKGIGVHSTLYKFTNGLGVGDSEQKIKQAFGDDFQQREGKGADVLTYKDKGLVFEIHKKKRTIIEIGIRRTAGGHSDSNARDSRKVIMLSEQPPGPITFPKIDRRPQPLGLRRGEIKSLPKYDPKSTDWNQVFLRGGDLSRLDLSNAIDDLLYACFDDWTVWPESAHMPEGFDPKKIMELGKNPGLSVRTLHKSGITGKGVGVAIIDQPLLTEHQEYTDRVRLYEENNVRDISRSPMHGAAVASIAVGKTVGVAPDADLYYIATSDCDYPTVNDPSYNFRYRAQSIRRLLEINRQLPANRKIRVISMSTGWLPSHDGYDEIMAACEEAKAAGIFVVSCCIDRVHGFKFHGLGRQPFANPDVFESYEYCLGVWAKKYYDGARDRLLVPMDSRAIACPTGSDKYVFYRQGGWSWSVPYIAGVYALAAQVEPEITPERFWALAMKTGRTIEL